MKATVFFSIPPEKGEDLIEQNSILHSIQEKIANFKEEGDLDELLESIFEDAVENGAEDELDFEDTEENDEPQLPDEEDDMTMEEFLEMFGITDVSDIAEEIRQSNLIFKQEEVEVDSDETKEVVDKAVITVLEKYPNAEIHKVAIGDEE